MKKAISLFLALVLCLSLCACGGNNTEENPYEKYAEYEELFLYLETNDYDGANAYIQNFFGVTEDDLKGEQTEPATEDAATVSTLALGETASTDLAEFTLENSQFTYYVSNLSTNFVEPTEEPNELFAASIGHCYVSLTFTITNKDRGGSISYAGSFPEWAPNWTVSYAGTDYSVKGFDLNNNAGYSSISLSYSAVVDKESGKMIEKHDSGNYLLSAGETVTLRAFGIIDVEPEALTDEYDFTVGVPNSKGEYEYFTYTVPAR